MDRLDALAAFVAVSDERSFVAAARRLGRSPAAITRTIAELETAAHRQGFGSLGEVDRAVLETSGTISFFAKKPVPEMLRHEEILKRLDKLTEEMQTLRGHE